MNELQAQIYYPLLMKAQVEKAAKQLGGHVEYYTDRVGLVLPHVMSAEIRLMPLKA